MHEKLTPHTFRLCQNYHLPKFDVLIYKLGDLLDVMAHVSPQPYYSKSVNCIGPAPLSIRNLQSSLVKCDYGN